MKKFVALVLFVLLVCTISACTSDTVDTAPVEAEPVIVEKEVQEETQPVAWEDFLDEYEAWVDQYIGFMQKYKENPSDLSLLGDYADMMTEMTDWAEKSQKVQDDLEKASPSEISKYSARLAQIATKLAKAGY